MTLIEKKEDFPIIANAIVEELDRASVSAPGAYGEGDTPSFVDSNPVIVTPDDDEDEGFVRDCVDDLFLLLSVYGFNSSNVNRNGFVRFWEKCALQVGNPVKYVKWKTSSFFAFHMSTTENPLEVAPCPKDADLHPNILLGGKVYSFLRSMKHNRLEDFKSFCLSVLYSGRGMQRPSNSMLLNSVEETFHKLTNTLPPNETSEREFLTYNGKQYATSKAALVAQIKRTVKEVLASTEYTWSDRIKPFFPSTSANYYSSQKKGGMIGLLLRDPDFRARFHIGDGSELINIKEELYTGKGDVYYSITANDEKLRRHFEELYRYIADKAEREAPRVKLVGLKESLKIRVISKGPPYLYTMLKPLQRKLWGALQKFDQFRLTGNVVDALHISKTVGRLKDDEKFISIDYSDATNSIYSWASEAAVDQACESLDLYPAEIPLVHKAMTKHFIDNDGILGEYVTIIAKKELESRFYETDTSDPRFTDENIDKFEKYIKSKEGKLQLLQIETEYNQFLDKFLTTQKHGQLMGSIISFPFLCMLNAAVVRYVHEIKLGRSLLLKQCPMTINGDDGLFRGNDALVNVWKIIAGKMGLSPSIGKVYVTKEFCNINSTNFIYHPEGYECNIVKSNEDKLFKWHNGFETIVLPFKVHLNYFSQQKYVNLGLLKGMKRSGGIEDLDDVLDIPSDLGARCTQFIEFCPSELRLICMKKFLHFHKDQLKKYHIPWFIPRRFGGLGFPSVGRFSPIDRILRIARKLFEHRDKYKFSDNIPLEAKWKTWKLVQHRFEQKAPLAKKFLHFANVASPRLDLLIDQRVVSYNDILGLMAVELLFTVDKPGQLFRSFNNAADEENYTRLQRGVIKDYYMSVQRAWIKATRDRSIPMPEPFNPTRYPVIYNTDDLPVIILNTINSKLQ